MTPGISALPVTISKYRLRAHSAERQSEPSRRRSYLKKPRSLLAHLQPILFMQAVEGQVVPFPAGNKSVLLVIMGTAEVRRHAVGEPPLIHGPQVVHAGRHVLMDQQMGYFMFQENAHWIG